LEVRYDRVFRRLSVLAENRAREGHLALPPGEPLDLRIFLDGSVVEIYANGRACVTERIYRPRPGNIDISLIAAGGRPRLESLEMWEMQPISPDRLTT
ncbi:MAG TPA: GH32 C-terminal domain-containing protein, partial [Bryobacteraceae bacterium]|nr:GH32 C-terminal domain-containing protein [Bryobacteraceae bacterium]